MLADRSSLVLSHFEFEGFRTVMPAQAGIQGEQAAASGYSAWIPAFAGMTQHSSTPQNHHDRLLGRSGIRSGDKIARNMKVHPRIVLLTFFLLSSVICQSFLFLSPALAQDASR